jgi:hypothetical protein
MALNGCSAGLHINLVLISIYVNLPISATYIGPEDVITNLCIDLFRNNLGICS